MATIKTVQAELTEKNVRSWLIKNRLEASYASSRPATQFSALTVSREHGAGGSRIAKAVAERMHWKLLDGELIDLLADASHSPRALIERVDERHVSWLNSLLHGIGGTPGLTQEAYVHRISRLIATAAQQGNVVIVGRGARFVVPREPSLSIRLTAPLEFRIAQIATERSMSKSQARRWVARVDLERSEFQQKYFHQESNASNQFDLVVNVAKLGEPETIQMIVETLQGNRLE